VYAVLTTIILFLLYNRKSSDSIPSTSTVKPRSSSKSILPSIAIITFTTQQSSYLYLSLRNHWAYAKAHNYDLIIDYDFTEERGPVWHKIPMIEDLVKKGQHEWTWWIDFDSLITNGTMKLENVIAEALKGHQNPTEVDMILTADCFPLNAGSMIIRNGPRILKYLDAMRVCGRENHDKSEQDCLRDMIVTNRYNLKKHTLMIPQWKINAFPPEIKCLDEAQRAWERGMFVIHFAGAWAHIKESDPTGFLMKKYENFIIWPS